eukprot:gnl/MRDRNA2_/MRDRNA2_46070_c0_seq1.p1 gnl/MRDRNA2_/MRDRNA2_46070_c0~~gnl/MRDRNA2_/MRDRNA2_46070_c0_seq1.p1  ORF type:complete len:110 (-),score=7.00 gnl/MRDRNA2_/MRDRNA2_46070_c0_seq1:5-334(-)
MMTRRLSSSAEASTIVFSNSLGMSTMRESVTVFRSTSRGLAGGWPLILRATVESRPTTMAITGTKIHCTNKLKTHCAPGHNNLKASRTSWYAVPARLPAVLYKQRPSSP